ncbi:fumarylacetoacetate hydrolase [Colletotrichum scovillei]|uniref:fumarylacetoacetate hydrolase n=1 Tax=Colletotrichum scovillei TaxID=1209932 RepID=UPI0015C3A155|nr:fumarylacetoacetate hydrolase [Colletotrichum scovillei]KAF4778888.1 fumarylacetoacetate hydrolase [Colletotrichum scovillei]
MSFNRLVRFEEDGKTHYGDMIDSSDDKGFDVLELDGSPWLGLKSTGRKVKTTKLLCPIEACPIIICVGLNYKQHAEEAKLKVPTFPVIFTKPSDALAGPLDDIKVHSDAQIQLDYEGELALNYVLGYTAGNDVSARNFQMPDASGGQFCYAKSFDGFAPVGPAIWSTESVPDPQKLHLTTIVNGDVVQETNTSTTLRRGTVIMTGTPSGVGYFRGAFLKDGDLVEVGISGLGRLANRIVF